MLVPPPYSSAALPAAPSASSGISDKVCRLYRACTQTPPSAPPLAMESATDLHRLAATMRRLEACGFYYEGLSLEGASKALHSSPVGVFLVRDSADPRFLFALSVRTERGPTSVRIHYRDGLFRLDAEPGLQDNMPSFECVLQLVDYYVRLSSTDKGKAHVWLDQSGRRDLHIRLSTPLYRQVASLQHLCRTTLARHVVAGGRLEALPLPSALSDYVKDYPYPQ